MFTLYQIKEAHSKVQSGADFPQYTRDLLSIGVLKYSIYVSDGHAEYIGTEGYTIDSEAEYPTLFIADETNKEKFRYYLKEHQSGNTGYSTFCKNSAETGVGKWTVDIPAKTCTYYDKSGSFVLEENIP